MPALFISTCDNGVMPRRETPSTRIPLGAKLTLTIDRLSLGGEGVGRAEGLVLFVPYAVPGDKLEVEVTEVQARFARARILQVIQPGTHRVKAPCVYHFQAPVSGERAAGSDTPSAYRSPLTGLHCGGCSMQQINYAAQLDIKRGLVQETFERLGGLKDLRVRPTLGMNDPWRYRNKVQQPVGWVPGKGMITGFYAPGSHDILDIKDCLVQHETSVRILNRTLELLEKQKVRAYDSATHHGWIRHFWVRTNRKGQAQLVFVTRSPEFPGEMEVLKALVEEFPMLVGIFQNVNSAKTNVVLGRQWRKLAGADFMEEQLGPLKFRLSPGSFFQVNTLQAEVLYETAGRYAGTGERLLDLYCGAGGIALWLASRFDQVGGVEEVQSAVDDAEVNAADNGIENARFQASPVKEFLMELESRAGGPSLTVTLDPPRAGCDPGVIQELVRLKPGRIVYVSCDPGTLARDVAGLVRGGYKVEEVQPVDLFPQTSHIETVVALTRARSV